MNNYADHLMKCINNSRDIALKELPHQDSNEHDTKEEIEKWYDTISKWVANNPPVFFVKYLEVTENYASKVTAVNYLYFDTNDEIIDASIKVSSELYDSRN